MCQNIVIGFELDEARPLRVRPIGIRGGQRAGFATDLDKALLVWETFRLVRVKSVGLIQIGWDDGAWLELDFGGESGIWWLSQVLPGYVD